jgi:hypothetical protein
MTWSAFLDTVEERINEARSALDNDEPPPETHTVQLAIPADLGPLPEELRERALAATSALADVEARTRLMMDDVQREIGNATRASRGARTYAADGTVPMYVDRQA